MVDVQVDAPAEETAEEDSPSPDPAVVAVEAAQRLTTALDALRPDLADPEDDELDEEIVFVRNGWIRITIAGSLHKLRRPFLGELRELDLSREADQEVLNQKNQELREETDVLLARAKEIETQANEEGIEPQRASELNIEATKLALRAHTASRAIVREAQRVRAAWWAQAFEMLTPPGYKAPADMPAWIGDVALQQRAIEHWQMVPLGRGDRKERTVVSPIR